MDCVDGLLRQSNCCPLDWHTIYNPLSGTSAVRIVPAVDIPASMRGKLPDDQYKGLFVPGIGLKEKTVNTVAVSRVDSFVYLSALRPQLTGHPSPSVQDLVVNSARVAQPCQSSATELAQVPTGRSKPLARCQSLSHAPSSGQSVKRSGFKAPHPNTRLFPSSSKATQKPAVTVAKPQSADIHAGLYVGVSAPEAAVNPAGTVLPRRFKPLRKKRPIASVLSSSGDVTELALGMTGMYISVPSPQKT